MVILALDVGSRRIGVAVTDPSESFALPLETIERTNLRKDLAAIAALAKERGVTTIVVGEPKTLKGEAGLAARKIDEFVIALRRAFGGNVERVDERLTTALVTKRLIEADFSRAKRKRIVDRLAAAAILETYLARRRGAR